MIVSMIVAMDENRGIGKDNRIPWHLPTDLKRFKRLTMGHHIIMGRKTYQSIGKLLPGRKTILLTRNPNVQVQDCIVAHSIEEALSIAANSGEVEVFIIGGGEIYRQSIPFVDRIYLTLVHASFEVDTYFPVLNPDQWEELESVYYPAKEPDSHSYTFKLLARKGSLLPNQNKDEIFSIKN